MVAGRAATEVARHFLEKYGAEKAIQIISARINGDGAKQDTEFWLDVIHVIEARSPSTDLGASLDMSGLPETDKPVTHG